MDDGPTYSIPLSHGNGWSCVKRVDIYLIHPIFRRLARCISMQELAFWTSFGLNWAGFSNPEASFNLPLLGRSISNNRGPNVLYRDQISEHFRRYVRFAKSRLSSIHDIPRHETPLTHDTRSMRRQSPPTPTLHTFLRAKAPLPTRNLLPSFPVCMFGQGYALVCWSVSQAGLPWNFCLVLRS